MDKKKTYHFETLFNFITFNIKRKQYIIFFLFFYFSICCINLASAETIIGQMEFDSPQFVALVENKETSDTYIYKEQEVIYLSEDESIYFKILKIKEEFILVSDKAGDIIAISKEELLPDSKKIVFLKGVKIEKIQFSYIYGNYDDSDFKFSKLKDDTIYLSRRYKSMGDSDVLGKKVLEDIEIEEISQSEFVVHRKAVEPILVIAENILESLIEKQEEEKQNKQHKTLNLRLSSSAAEIILGSSGILVERFFLKKIPSKIDLQEGDLIKRINKKPINGLIDVYEVFKNIKAQKGIATIEVDLIRNYRLLTKYYTIK